LELKRDGTQYIHDFPSATRIRVYRKSILEQTTVTLVDDIYYKFTVTLEAPPTTYEMQVYYEDYDGALYSVIDPNPVTFTIQS